MDDSPSSFPNAKSPSTAVAPQLLRLSEWASLQAYLLWIYDHKTPFPGGEGEIANQEMAAWLVRKGTVTIRINGQEAVIKAGDWVFFGKGKRWQRFSMDCHLLSMRFSATWPSGEDIFARDLFAVAKAIEYPQLEIAAKKLLRVATRYFPGKLVFLMQQHGPIDAYFKIHEAFCAWFPLYVKTLTSMGFHSAHIGHIDPRVLKVREILLKHPLQFPFKEKNAAQSVGLSTIQLNRLFMKHFGHTMRQSIEERRIEYAINSLRGSSSLIKQIGYELGFSSLAHFSTWFRRKKGIYPHHYRKKGNLFF